MAYYKARFEKKARHGGFERQCCLEDRITSHYKGWWKPKFIWERNEFVIDPEKGQNVAAKEKRDMEKLRVMRENQFRNFLAEVFVLHDKGVFKDKISWDLKMTQEEREQWVEDMFKKYWSESEPVKMIKKVVPITEQGSMKRRSCSCVKGYYDNKGNHHPAMLPNDERQRFMTIMVAPDIVTPEMRDAALGRSVGVKNKADRTKAFADLDDLMAKRV